MMSDNGEEKVVVTSQIVLVDGDDWGLRVSRVVTRFDEIMYAFSPLDVKSNYSEMRDGFLLTQKEMERYVYGLIELSSDFNGEKIVKECRGCGGKMGELTFKLYDGLCMNCVEEKIRNE